MTGAAGRGVAATPTASGAKVNARTSRRIGTGQGVPQQPYHALEQAREAQASNGIGHSDWFPPEEPAGHRETQRCVAHMKKLHITTPTCHPGETTQSEPNLSPETRKVNEPKVPWHCTKVIGMQFRSC